MKIIFLLLLTINIVYTIPVPQDDAASPDPDAASPDPADETTPAANPDETTAKPDGPTPEANPDETTTNPTPEGSEPGETTTPEGGNESKNSSNENVETVDLTMRPDETTPENVRTDRYGAPVTAREVLEFTLPGNKGLRINSVRWQTYYTRPATKPGCLCITRGPLTKFKLIGNIHFPKLKVTPERYVSIATERTTTLCPPCDCSNCTMPPVDLMF